MKKIMNIVRKQLLLAGSLLVCVVAYGDIPTNLPGRLWAQVGTQYNYVYYPDIPILIEKVSSTNHRVIAIEAHRIKDEDTFGYKFRSKDGTERLVVTPASTTDNKYAQDDTPQNSHMFMCYDKEIPDILVYKFLPGGKIGDDILAKFENLDIGFNNFYQESDKKRHVVVLPMLKYVNSLYKDFDKKTKTLSNYVGSAAVPAVTAGDRVYFQAEGEGDIVVLVKNGNYFNSLSLENEVGNIYSFKMPLSNEIYVFSYINSNNQTYYSSNYKLFTPTVYPRPSWSFVNANQYSSTLYISEHSNNKIILKNTSSFPIRISTLQSNNKYGNYQKCLSGNTVEINVNGSKWCVCVEGLNKESTEGKVETTYTINRVPKLDFGDEVIVSNYVENCKSFGEVVITNNYSKWVYPYNNCDYKFTVRKYSAQNGYEETHYPSGETFVYPRLEPQKQLILTRSYKFGTTTYSKDSIIIIEDKYSNYGITPKIENNIKGCQNGNDNSAGKISVTAKGGFEPYEYSYNGVNYGQTKEFSYKTTGYKIFYVKDRYECVRKDSIELKLEKELGIKPELINNIKGCQNGNDNSAGKISVTASGGSGNYTFSSDGVSYDQTNEFTFKTKGTKTFYVKDNTYGCEKSDSVELKLENELVLSLKPTYSDVCADKDGIVGTITATATKGSGQYTYSSDGKNYDSNNVFSYTTQGTKTVYVQDNKYGCVKSGNENIKINNELIITPKLVNNIKGCENGNDGTEGKITVTASGGSGNYTFSSDGVNYGQTKEFTYKTTGTKTFYVKDVTNSCIKSKGINLSIQSLTPTLNISNKNVCAGEDGIAGTITINVRNGSGNYTYSSDGVNYGQSNTFAYKTQGTKTVYVKDDTYGCVKSVQGNVKIQNELIITPKLVSNIQGCENGNDNSAGKITVKASGGSKQYTFSSDGVNYNRQTSFTYKTIGPKIFYVKDGRYGCVKSDTIGMEINNKFVIEPEVSIRTGCADENEIVGAITIKAKGGSGNYTYSSDGKTYGSTKIFNYKDEGSKTVYVKDGKYGCVEDSMITIGLKNKLEASIIPPQKQNGYDIACNGGEAELEITINGGTKYDGKTYLFNNAPISSGYKTKKGEGTHSFTITDAKGCSVTPSITLSEPTKLEITKLESDNADCDEAKNGKVEVAASGGAGALTYYLSNISDGTKDNKNGTFTGLGAKPYTLSVKDDNNCVTPETIVTVGSNLKLEISKIEPAECYDERLGSITLAPKFKDGFSGGFNYWLNNEKKSGPKIENVMAGQHKVKVQPVGSNCFVELDKVEVGGPQKQLKIEDVTVTPCTEPGTEDGALKVKTTGGTTPHTIKVNGNDDVAGLPSGSYTISLTDKNNCHAKDTIVTIAEPKEKLKLEVSPQSVKCHGTSTGAITASASGGWGEKKGEYKYTLLDSVNNIVGENTTGKFTNLLAGDYTVIVLDKVVQEGKKVTKTAEVKIEQPDPLSISKNETVRTMCNGDSTGKIILTVKGGSPHYSLDLYGKTYTDNNGIIEIDGLPAGLHQYTVVDHNKCKIENVESTVGQPSKITIIPKLPEHNGYNIKCNGETDTIKVSATGGNGQYKFSINDSPFTNDYFEENKKCELVVGAGEYKIICVDQKECRDTLISEEAISQPEKFVIIDTATTQPDCYGYDGEITVKVSGGVTAQNYNYSLNGADTVNDGSQHTFTGVMAKADHKVVVTDANGCSDSIIVTLNQPDSLAVKVSKVEHNLCHGDSAGRITFTISGGTGSYYYALNGSDSVEFGKDKAISGLPAQESHSIVVSDAHGCKTDAISQEIEQPDPITAKTILNDYNGNNIRCFGDADDARIKISGGVGNYTTTLGDQTLTGKDVQFVGLKKGNYSYKVVDGNDCSETFDFEMRQPDNLTFTYIDSADAKCHNGTNGTMTAKVKGGVRSYTYNVTNSNSEEINELTTGADNYSYNSFAADKYELKVTDANNCVISHGFTIGQPDPLTVSVSTLKDVVCKGTETGEVSATAKGGTSPYSYSWNNGMTGQSIQNLPAGEYSVMVTDANNCQSEVDENGVKAQTTIDEPAVALTMLEPVYANPTCSYNKDGEITINVSGGWGGYGYTLNGVSYGSNKIKGLDEGTYTAKVKDAGGCEVPSAPVKLKKPEALSFENKIGTIICKGGATDVTITSASGGTGGNYSYSIDGGNTWQSGTTFANVVSGSYILRMKDGNECLATDKEITVTEPELLVLKEDVKHNYNGSTHEANGKITVTPQGGVMPYSYQWKDTTVTSQELDNIGFGIYTIIVTDNLGCVGTGTYYINDNNPTPEVVDAICPEGTEGSIRFGDTVKCTKVEWYNARTEELLPQSGTKTITGLPKGIYKAKLFNDTQVTYIYAEVKAPDSLKYATSQRNIDCHGDNTGMASVSFTGGVVPVSVVWKNQSDDEISHSQTIENLAKGKYTAYISDAKNCQSSSQALEFDITEPAEAFVLAESAHNDVKCHGNNDAVVVLSVSGNQGAVTYFQDEAAIPSNTANTLYAGAYTFYAVDEKNCQTQPLNVTVSQPDPLSSSVKTIMPIKCAAETGSVEVEAEGGTAPYSYKVLEQTEFRLSPVFDGLTTADYKFVVKDNNNCHDTASYLLTEPEQLVITGSKLKDEYCGHSDGTISVDVEGGTGGYDIRWSDYQTGEMASGLPAGSYMVSVYDENRCLATETYDIKDIPAPVISIKSIDSTKCYGSADGVAELNVSLGTGAIAYHWETETTGVPYSGKLKAGQQSVVAVDELGCADTAQFTMPQPDSMKIEIAVANPLCFNDNSGELTATVSNYKTGLSYKWDNGVAGSENRGLYAGTYGVSVTNANGCVAKKSATLVYPAKITIKKLAIADTKCDQPNGSVTVTATGGTGVLQYGVNQVAVAAANKIEGLPSGNHKLTVVDENQCSIDSTIFVGANVPPVLVINTRDDVKCHGDANGKVSVGVEGGRMPFVYSWDNGDRTTMSTKNGLGVGSHKAYVYDGFGCSDTLDFAIDEPYVLEIYESSSSDPVCYGYSNGQIVAGVMGGTAPYTYQWGDKQNTAKATGLAAGSHYLNVTDKNGCKAKKYFTLSNPQPVVVDIPEVISICSNQTADIDAGHEGSFHYWSSANGFESVAQNISVNKKGTYVVTVTTLDGCIGSDSTFVNVSEKEINANFLLQSDAYVGDTIVMIEISWPLPESIEWSCPDGMTIISDAGDEIEMVADKEGVYDIGLTTYNDICTEQTFKSIVVNPRSQKPKGLRLMSAQKIIKNVNVYPNPVTGPFNLEIELNEEHDVTIEIMHVSGDLKTKRHMKGDRQYVINFSNADLNAGIHTITVSAGSERITKKIVVLK